MLQVNCMPDHIHILAGVRPHQSISSLIQNVKTESSKDEYRKFLTLFEIDWDEKYIFKELE